TGRGDGCDRLALRRRNCVAGALVDPLDIPLCAVAVAARTSTLLVNAYGALGIAVAETLALPGRDLVGVLMAQRRVIEALGRVGHRHLSGALPGSHGVVGAARASLQSNQNNQSECIAAHGSLL